ncbi:MAG: hypothetical protein CMI50_13665 [Paracoccus sp.]|nr:hypothetical protein [Paracoccus sp. (in: a-proteobacteria)]MBA49773.1 hypothetical protein [Paracoccus sp. (in: a-proteobacteria)]|tara:strand:+ start:1133 stop:2164 length:1032 start_codon:yes stop_codon:yes gene_type:complete
MRVLVGILLWMMAAGPVLAAPAPPPPEDFAALQYIDGAGCVFRRADGEWIPKLDKTGVRICGFPPTFSTRRTDPETDRVLPLGEAKVPPSPEDRLIQALAFGLRAGEFTADPRVAQPIAAPAEASGQQAFARDLDTVMTKEAEVRAAMAAMQDAPDGLCEKLGYVADPGAAPVLGQDVTLGLCAGMRPVTLSARVRRGAMEGEADPQDAGQTGRRTSPAVAGSSIRRDRRPAASRPPDRAARKAVASSGPARRSRAATVAADRVEMIPASARYVRIGDYAAEANAAGAIRRLSDLGYRVAQTYGRRGGIRVRIILAGPFRDRRSLVEALNHLRRNGYPRAVAR